MKNAEWSVLWASVSPRRAQQLRSGRALWSADSSAIPAHLFINFKKVVKIKQMRIKNEYDDHDCIRQCSLTPLYISSFHHDCNWSEEALPYGWVKSNEWSFASKQVTDVQ